MALNLVKGGRTNVSKNIMFKLVYKVNQSLVETGIDFDVVAMQLNENDKAPFPIQDYTCYFNSSDNPLELKTKDGSIRHSGDKRGFDVVNEETIFIDFDKMDSNVNQVMMFLTVYEETDKPKYNFGQVKSCVASVIDADTNDVLVEYDLTEDFSMDRGLIIARFYKKGSDWKFQAQGEIVKECANDPIALRVIEKIYTQD